MAELKSMAESTLGGTFFNHRNASFPTLSVEVLTARLILYLLLKGPLGRLCVLHPPNYVVFFFFCTFDVCAARWGWTLIQRFNFSSIIVNSVWCFSKKKNVTECGDAFKN